MEDEEIKKLKEAGRIAKIVREEAAKIAKPGMKLLELAELIEKRIRELGGEPAFPVNLSLNEVAAHYTPVVDDKITIPDNSILKIDIGVHVDGYIADTATTVTFNPALEGLVEATSRALEKALEVVRPGIRANEIGKVIEETIKNMGYKVIKNLSGHSIDRYLIHSGRSIPNYNEIFNRFKLNDGVYAIEPFATNGAGFVKNGHIVTIYSLKGRIPRNLPLSAKKLVEKIWKERRTLPFCERWYKGLFGSLESLRNTIKILCKKGVFIEYPILVERGYGMVSQHEHTIVIYKGEVIITTL